MDSQYLTAGDLLTRILQRFDEIQAGNPHFSSVIIWLRLIVTEEFEAARDRSAANQKSEKALPRLP